ncbi:hypothetical protein [Methylococcus sp. EFPC2]|uniref:hypothetical protein n=1 Tax=Methylococcus sp. EFPC2 TaxID=2812648 RepID=UPI001968882C|nr:hypothetical protein [Methylococcus sp. EFPC2]QSA96606.1 hypothetical protein JWZ97_15500 [Methylococcus sp. EFPC2]
MQAEHSSFLQYFFVAIALFLVLFYFLRKKQAGELIPDEISADTQGSPAGETVGGAIAGDLVLERRHSTGDLPATAASRADSSNTPEDSVLKRHYLAHLKYLIEEVSAQRPTDSVLRRHHEQSVASELEAVLSDDSKLKNLIRIYDEHRKTALSRRLSLVERAVIEPGPVESTTTAHAPTSSAPPASHLGVPEDSVLRRHFQTHIKSLIESLSFPLPTDSVLRRHYEQFIASELEDVLSDGVKLESVARRYDELRKSA